MAQTPGWEDADDPDWVEEGEALLFQEDARAEERARARDEALLRAIEREHDPVTQGEHAARRLWEAVCRRLRSRGE